MQNESIKGMSAALPVFIALSDPTRLSILSLLATRGTTTMTRLAADTGLSRQAIHKHVWVLENVGLAQSWREGRERVVVSGQHSLRRAGLFLERLERACAARARERNR